MFDLNQLVLDVERLLRRLIGEHIELDTLLESRWPHVRLDSGQLEQLVINLAVNARDAMPSGRPALDCDREPRDPGPAAAPHTRASRRIVTSR